MGCERPTMTTMYCMIRPGLTWFIHLPGRMWFRKLLKFWLLTPSGKDKLVTHVSLRNVCITGIRVQRRCEVRKGVVFYSRTLITYLKTFDESLKKEKSSTIMTKWENKVKWRAYVRTFTHLIKLQLKDYAKAVYEQQKEIPNVCK